MIITRFQWVFSFVRCLTRLCWCLSRRYGCLNRIYGCPTGVVAVLKDASVAKDSLIPKPDVSSAIIDKASSSVSAIVSDSFSRDSNESLRLERRSIDWRIFWRESFSSLRRFGGDPSWCTSGDETEFWREDGDRERDLFRDLCLLWDMFSDFKYPEKQQISPKRNLLCKNAEVKPKKRLEFVRKAGQNKILIRMVWSTRKKATKAS